MNYPAFIKVAHREIQITAGNPSIRNLVFIIPLVVFILLAFIYVQGTVNNISVAVFDKDNSSISRKLISFLNSSESINVTYYLSSEDEFNDFFLNHPEHAVFCIPSGFERDIIRGNENVVTVFTNSSNIIYGNILLREAYTIVNTFSAGITIQKLETMGLTPSKAMNYALPISVIPKPLFNPVYNYLYYLVPGLFTVLLQMIIFFISTRAINSEITNNTFNQLLEVSNFSPLNIIIGKSFVYTFYGFGLTAFIALLFVAFEIPFKDSILDLIVLFGVFIFTNVVLGLMISSTIDDEILSLDIAFFYNSPAFVFSGFTFPMFGMPFFDSLYAQFIPYTHFLYAFFKVYQIGTPIEYIRPELLALLLFAVTGFVTTYIALYLKINKKHSFSLASD